MNWIGKSPSVNISLAETLPMFSNLAIFLQNLFDSYIEIAHVAGEGTCSGDPREK